MGWIGAVAFAALSYGMGFQQGADRGRMEVTPAPVVVAQTFPYSGNCGEILELAWAAQPDKPVTAGPNR